MIRSEQQHLRGPEGSSVLAFQEHAGGLRGAVEPLLECRGQLGAERLNIVGGRAAEAAFDALSDENPEATCVGRPTPSALVSTGLYLMEIDLSRQETVIVFRSEWFNEVRMIYMDGCGHPDPGERFATGHSIGRWEGDTLVVDTANFTDHRSPYQIGVPSGGEKHVVERYRLTEDGTHIDLEFVLEDPEYLAESMSHRRQLIHSPHIEILLAECDPETTSRFLAN